MQSLFVVNFLTGIALALLFTIANTLFLAEFPASMLPYSFIVTAVVLLAGNHIYSRLEERHGLNYLNRTLLYFAAVFTGMIWFGTSVLPFRGASFVLLVSVHTLFYLTSASFWGLCALLFNVREGKRIFGVLGTADLPARLLGYLSVSVFAPFFELQHLILFAAGCFVAAGWLFRLIPEVAHQHHDNSQSSEAALATRHGNLKSMFKSFAGGRLVVLLAWMAFVSTLSFALINFAFSNEIQVKYKSKEELGAFFGVFFTVARLAVMVFKATLSGRSLERLGVRSALLILPGFVLLCLPVLLAPWEALMLYTLGFLWIATDSMKQTLYKPLFLTLFQPLKAHLRLRGHSLAKGIMTPLGLLFGGLALLLLLQLSPDLLLHATIWMLLPVTLVWIFLCFGIHKSYIATLSESLRSGFFRGEFRYVNEPGVREVLIQKLKSENPLEVIYAADAIDRLDKNLFRKEIPKLLEHPAPAVRGYALSAITEQRLDEALPAAEARLKSESSPEIRKKILQTLVGLNRENTELLFGHLHDVDPGMRRVAIVHLLRSGDLQAIVTAGQELLGLLHSDNKDDRALGAQIIGETGEETFQKTLEKLIDDSSVDVRRQAIFSAGDIRASRLVGKIWDLLHDYQLGNTASQALGMIGEPALYKAEEEFAKHPQSLSPIMRGVASFLVKMNTDRSRSLLERMLLAMPLHRPQLLVALRDSGYRTNAARRNDFIRLAKEEIDRGKRLMSLHTVFHSAGHFELLSDALKAEAMECEKNLFLIFSFVFEKQTILKASENLDHTDKNRLANASELLSAILPRDLSGRFIHLLEFNHLPNAPVPNPHIGEIPDLLQSIITDSENQFNSWTRACAIYDMADNPLLPDIEFLKSVPSPSEKIIQETLLYALKKSPHVTN